MTTPRRDSASTPSVLTGAGVTVAVALASRVTSGGVAVSTGGAQADRKIREQRTESSMRSDLAKQHHRDGRKYEDKKHDDKRADHAAA